MTDPTVFVSYSHKDEAEKDRVLTHLHVLQQAGLIDVWSDDRIGAGTDCQLEIEQAISRAKVAVLLVTASFLSSQFILEQEVPALLQRRQREGLVVFPVIARACAWRKVNWLARMNVRPKNGRPVWSDAGGHVDEDLSAIAEEIAEAVQPRDTQGASSRPCASQKPHGISAPHRAQSSPVRGPDDSALRVELVKLLRQHPPLTARAGRDAWLMNLPAQVRDLITCRDNNCGFDLAFIVDAVWEAQLRDGGWPILILVDAVLVETAGLRSGQRLGRLREEIAQYYEARATHEAD